MRYWRRGDFYKIVFIPSRVHPGVAIPQGAPTGQKIGDLYMSNTVFVRDRVVGTRYYDVIETI